GPAPEVGPEVGAVRSARALLGVTADADAPELTRAYRQRARCPHPHLTTDPEATYRFQGLNAAYRLALDAAARRPPPTRDPAAGYGWGGPGRAPSPPRAPRPRAARP